MFLLIILALVFSSNSEKEYTYESSYTLLGTTQPVSSYAQESDEPNGFSYSIFEEKGLSYFSSTFSKTTVRGFKNTIYGDTEYFTDSMTDSDIEKTTQYETYDLEFMHSLGYSALSGNENHTSLYLYPSIGFHLNALAGLRYYDKKTVETSVYDYNDYSNYGENSSIEKTHDGRIAPYLGIGFGSTSTFKIQDLIIVGGFDINFTHEFIGSNRATDGTALLSLSVGMK